MLWDADVFRTLTMNARQKRELLDRLDALDAEDGRIERRKSIRYPYRRMVGLMARIEHPGGTVSTHLVTPRNISDGGVSVLHGGFVHAKTRMTIRLVALNGKPSLAVGHVARCICVFGRVHEIALVFDAPIKVADFVDITRIDEKKDDAVTDDLMLE